MAAFNYTRARATATRLVRRFGQTAQLRSTIQVGGEPWDPASGTESPLDTDILAVVLNFETDEIDGTIITQNDRRIIVAADGVIDPTAADRIVIGGAAFQIMSVEAIEPADTTVYFEIRGRA